MSKDKQDLRYQLDAPARKVREDLGLPPLGSLSETLFNAPIKTPIRVSPLPGEKFPSFVIESSRPLTADEFKKVKEAWKKRASILNRFTTSTGPR